MDIGNHILEWIENGDRDDCIRVIRGEPGSGKSSFLKILAAKLAQKKQKVLYIPLYNYDVNSDFKTAVNKFFRLDTRCFSYDLISSEEKNKIVVLFDGLDELSMQGKVLEDIADSFVRDVTKNAPLLNKYSFLIQVVIAGRNVLVQRSENLNISPRNEQ